MQGAACMRVHTLFVFVWARAVCAISLGTQFITAFVNKRATSGQEMVTRSIAGKATIKTYLASLDV